MPAASAPVLIAIASGLAYWFLFQLVYKKKYRPLPYKSALLSLLFAGSGSWLLASVFNSLFMNLAGIAYLNTSTSLMDLGTGSLIIGTNEESLKFLLTLFLARTSSKFKQPPVALAYAGATALGFATVENLAYALEAGSTSVLLRAITATPVHLGAAAIWSIGLAKGKFLSGDTYCKASACYLLLAIGAHACYNFGCVSLALWSPMLAVGFAIAYGFALLAVTYVCLGRLLEMHELRVTRVRHEQCPVCGKSPKTRHSHCSHCGAPLGIGFGLIIRSSAPHSGHDTAPKTHQE